MANFRDYEISIWTLQDEFITVLKPSNIEKKGQTQDGKVILKTDGTKDCKFSIPKFLYDEAGVRTFNSLWDNVDNGNIAKNLRKIKVIFNKNTDDEFIEEFVIIDVKERHEEDKVFCDISCEGLAFHELGKKGYKISLSSDIFNLEDYDWFITGETEGQPRATLQYWNNKFLKPVPVGGFIDRSVWYYEVQMDWSSYTTTARDIDKVYEEEYTSSWSTQNNKLIPVGIETAKEKERLVDIEESNIYNITQKLAEIFGVFCKYVYLYDENYHITGRRIVYYNNFIQEQEGYYDLTYPYSTSAITRDYDGKDITTKMFVSVSNNDSDINIMNVEANKSREDYLLNFDYLYKNNDISEEQYNTISDYEYKMHNYNIQLETLSNQINILQTRAPEVKANLQIAINAIQLDKDRISAASDLLNSLDVKDQDNDGAITISSNNPDSAIMLLDTKANDGTYYINITKLGVQPETLHIYKTINFVSSTTRLTDEIEGVIEYDEYGNVNRVSHLTASAQEKKTVYLTYKYIPVLYTQKVAQAWTARLALDLKKQAELQLEDASISQQLEELSTSYNNLLGQKKAIQDDFEKMMGPALRESYWRPEDYKDYGDKYLDSVSTGSVNGVSGFTTFIWDNELFDEEQKNYYNLGINETQIYYPCINLANHLNQIKDHIDDLSFLFYDYNGAQEPGRIRALTVGSQSHYGFANYNNSIIPVLILTGVESMTEESLARLVSNGPQIGKLTTTMSGSTVNIAIDKYFDVQRSDFINLNVNNTFSVTDLRYPRIQINSLKLKNNDDELSLKYNDVNLKNYIDYLVLTRIDTVNEQTNYYITPKAECILKQGSLNYTFQIKFALSNADTSIYLDALKVLKENAFPRVSYTINPSVFEASFILTAYNKLNRIVNINDVDLGLKDVQGYISQVELNLDEPWNDKYEIQNYRNKFEDLFSTIVAQTESMQKNAAVMDLAAAALTPEGYLNVDVIQNTLRRVDLDYAFNNGKLTINEKDGIWGISDSGVVAFRGGGIFTATEKNESDNWVWNTGITPEGINADLITTGQLDTNRIRIYAGDKVRFQLNGDGLFAYKSIFEDEDILEAAKNNATIRTILADNQYSDLDKNQYVVHDENGLFLIAKKGAYILNENKNDFVVLNNDVERVAISWGGLTLKNWNNEKVFYADADTGNLTLRGRVEATAFVLANSDPSQPDISFDDYLNNTIDDRENIKVFYSNSAPSSNVQVNDLWYDTDADPAKVYKYDGTTWNDITTTALAQALISSYIADKKADKNASDLSNAIIDINGDISNLQSQIDGNITSWFYNGVPTISNAPANTWTTSGDKNAHLGDLYYDLTTGYCYRWLLDGSTYKWERITDTDVTKALQDAATAQSTADKKIITYISAASNPTVEIGNQRPGNNISYPSGINAFDVGDLWINTSSNNALYRWNGSDWQLVRDTTNDAVIANLMDEVDGVTTTYYGTQTEAASYTPDIGDFWYDITNTNDVKIKRYNGTQWVDVTDLALQNALADAATAQATADGKIKTYTAPASNSSAELANQIPNNTVPANKNSGLDDGDLWINTSANNALYRYHVLTNTTGTWQLVQDTHLDTDVQTLKTDAVINSIVQYGTSTSNNTPPTSWSTTTPSWAVNQYVWMRTQITKANGDVSYTPSSNGVCIQAAAARSINLTGENVFLRDVNNNTTTPSSITLTAEITNLTVGKWYYKNSSDGWTEISSNNQQTTYSLTPSTANIWNNNKAIIKVEDTTAAYSDIFSIVLVTNGENGNIGHDASQVFVTNENISFAADADGLVTGRQIISNIVAYTGLTKVTPVATIASGTISGQLTATIGSASNNELPITISAVNGTTLNNQTSGTIVVNIASPISTSLRINWTKLNRGRDGNDGTSVTILGSYDTLAALQAAHPTGSAGDSYIIGTDLYVWSLDDSAWINVGQIKGEDGHDGLPTYVHFAYATNAIGTENFSTHSFEGATYLGVYSDNTQADSTNATDYTWSLIKGTDGSSPTLYELAVSSSAIVKDESATNLYNPTYITLSATSQVGNEEIQPFTSGVYEVQYYNNSNWITIYSVNNQYIIPTNVTATMLKCSLYLDNAKTTLLDQQTIPIISAGQDAYSVVLSNENHSFSGDSISALPGSTTCEIYAYKGITRVAAAIGTITGMPIGMTVSISNNNTTGAVFTVSVTSAMITKNGVLNVPILVDNKLFNMKFSYSLILAGINGENGAPATRYFTLCSTDTVTRNHTYTEYYYVSSNISDSRAAKIGIAQIASSRTDEFYSTYTPKTIIISAYSQTGEEAITDYFGRIKIEKTNDNETWTTVYQSTKDESNYEYVFIADDTTIAYRYFLYAAGSFSTILDQKVISVITAAREIVATTILYRLESSITPPTKPTAKVTSTSTGAGVWTTAVPQYIDNYYYFRCSQNEWNDNTIDWSDPYIDYGITVANQNATTASTKAGAIVNYLNEAFNVAYDNGVFSDYTAPWGDTYKVAITSSEGMLLGSASNFTIANGNTSTSGSALVMDSSGIALHGASINLTTSTNTGTSVVSLTPTGITIGATGNLIINTSNVGIDSTGAKDNNTTYPNASQQKTYFRLGSTVNPGLLFDGADLWIKGNLYAANTYIINSQGTKVLLDTYLDNAFETGTEVTSKIQNAFSAAADIINAANKSVTDINNYSIASSDALYNFYTKIKNDYTPTTTTGTTHHAFFKEGDIWKQTVNGTVTNTYMAVSNWDEVYSSASAAQASSALSSPNGWNKIYNGSFANVVGANLVVDAAAGAIDLSSSSSLNLTSSTLNLTGSSSINIATGGTLSLSGTAGISLSGTGKITLASNSGITLLTNSTGTLSKFKLDSNGVELGSGAVIKLMSGNDNSVSALELSPTNGIRLNSSETITLFSGAIGATNGAAVEISKDKILFGVSNTTSSTTAVEMTKDYLILAAGNGIGSLRSSDITLANTLTGLKLTKDGFGFSNVSSTTRNVVLINSSGIRIASGTSGNDLSNSGSIITISPTELSLGSLANLNVNTNNVKISSGATGNNTVFGLGTHLNDGQTSNYSLQFVNGSLYITGAVKATSFELASGTSITQGSSTYNLSDMQSSINSVEATSVVVKYTTSSSGSTTPASGWSENRPTTINKGQYLWTWTRITYGNNTYKDSYQVSYQGQDGTNGIDGINGTNGSDGNRWYTGTTVPASAGILSQINIGDMYLDTSNGYVYRCTVGGSSGSAATWVYQSTIKGANGTDGTNGTNGYNTATIYLYQRAASVPSKPSSALTYTFSTKVLSGTLGSWTQTIPSGTDPVYVTVATAYSNTDTDSIAANEWSAPVVLAQNGTNGTPGLNVATVFLYQRAVSTPSKPSAAITYTFANGAVSGLTNNWAKDIPASNGNPCYVIQATASNTATTDSIAASEWSTPIILVQNGANGESVTSVTEYYLATSANTGVTTSTSGWTTTIQTMTATNKYLWNYEVITGSTGHTLNTTAPVIIGVYGDKGTAGESISSITEYYLASSANSGVTTSTSGWTTTIQTTDATKKYLWNYEKVIGSSGSTLNTTTPSIINTYVTDGTPGSKWYTGTALSGATSSASTGISYTNLNDLYLDTDSGYVYECTTAGASGTAVWTRRNYIKGTDGNPGAVWYSGTAITGTNTTAQIFSGSGISDAHVGDMYLNTSTSNTYKCTIAGNAATAKWAYVNNIKGGTGSTGASVTSITNLYARSSATETASSGKPTQPTTEVTNTSTSPNSNVWTKSVPIYSSIYPYYWRCEQIVWSTGTISWSAPYIDRALTDANRQAYDASAIATSVQNSLDPIITNGISSGIWNNVDYGVILGNTSTSKPMLIGSRSGITIASDAGTGDSAVIVMNSTGIAVSSAGTIALDGGSISIKGSENGGSIQFTKADGTLLFSLSNDGSVVCQTLHVTGDVIVDGTITGTNVTPTGSSITWYGGYSSVNGTNYYFGWTGQELTAGTTYTVNISINAKNITSNTAILTPSFYAPGSSAASFTGTGHSTGSYIAWNWTGSFIFTPTSARITPLQWGSLAYARLFYNASSSSQFYTSNSGYYGQANSPQITLEFIPQ